jgi:hypothetical protein
MPTDHDEQPGTMARITALLGHLSTIVWIADRDAAPEELIEQIRVEVELAKALGVRAPGAREEERAA